MHHFEECEQFNGYKRAICRNEVPGKPLNGSQSVNAYRAAWGLAPLSLEQTVDRRCEQAPEAEPSPPLPPLLIRGWNFASAMARWAVAGMPRRSQEEIEARLTICQTCEFLQNNHCSKCGCACIATNQVVNKLALATEKCPLGKWE
ncbi:MAG: hypothetical protein JWP89_385 [Schlesneria sp.]|nr:hypothetical protein [Schlesneria sp.]